MAPTQQQVQASKSKATVSSKRRKAKVERYLKSTQPQLVEKGAKSTLLFKGIRCSQGMTTLLQELRTMAAPNAKLLSKKNQIVAFDQEGQQSIEFLTTKNDCALFAMATHNKKRPHHLTMGRTFDHQLLDLAELSMLRFKSMNDYRSVPKKRIGSKPLMLFVGDVWQSSEDYRNLQNLLIDFYRGDVVDQLVVSGLDHLMVFTAAARDDAATSTLQALIHQRTYFCKLKKGTGSGAPPLPLLTPCGPDLDFALRRTQWADKELHTAARQQPARAKQTKRKNQTTNLFGETLGRLHLEKQDIDKRQGRKSKALRRAEKQAAQEEAAEVEGELEREQQ